MGCASSTLDRHNSLGRSRTLKHGQKQKQAISVVGILVKKNSLHLIGSECHNIPQSLYKKVKCLRHGKKPLLQGKGANELLGNPNFRPIWLDNGEDNGPFANVHMLESPPKLCSEQERRLRCANMEVPATGLVDFSSDDDDDEGDGFEFAKLEGSINSEQGPLWTPITSFNSEQGAKKAVPLHKALQESPKPQVSTEDDLEFKAEEERHGGSISEPELEVLISPQYTDFPDNHSLSGSPQYVASSQVSPSSPLFERFSSNSTNDFSRLSFTSEESLLFPGFTTREAFEINGSVSPSVASLAGSVTDWSLENVAIEESASIGHTGKWGSSPPSWTWTSPSDSPPDGRHTFRWDPSSSYWDTPSPAKALHMQTNETHPGALIPGLPDDLAQLCLMRVPFIKYNHSLRLVCRQWRAVISSEEFFKTRSALGIHEPHISFVVHGNRVQIFSLQAHQWFCLPPLPRGDGSISPEWRLSPEWGLSPPSAWSSPEGRASDLGIDPYDWWQINTIAGLDGTLFVIGGDQADIRSFMHPSKPTGTVHKYDSCCARWVAVSPMQMLRSHAAAVTLGKLLYVAGGNEDVEQGASAEMYDVEQNKWSLIPRMNSSMRTCVGVNHEGCIYVKGESSGPACHVEGEIFNPSDGRWSRMQPGMRKGLERGPVSSCNSELFVADWKDSQLKVYEFRTDSWLVISKLPAKISRLVGHSMQLYALTGKIKMDPYNHHVISDAPAEVWRLDLRKVMGSFTSVKALLQETTLLKESDGDCVYGKFVRSSAGDCYWECVWSDPKLMAKSGGLAWVPCIAHCTLFED